MQPATFTVDRVHGISVVHLKGDLRVDSVPEISRTLFESLQGEKTVVVDLTELSYIDSAGIATLVALYKRTRDSGTGRIVLCGASPQIWGVFKTMKLDSLFESYSTLDQALEAVDLVDTKPPQS